MNSDKKRELDRKKSELEILMVKPEDFENEVSTGFCGCVFLFIGLPLVIFLWKAFSMVSNGYGFWPWDWPY